MRKRHVCAKISTHSRAKAAGWAFCFSFSMFIISTHSRAKAAGKAMHNLGRMPINFNSQPREGGWQTVAEGEGVGLDVHRTTTKRRWEEG